MRHIKIVRYKNNKIKIKKGEKVVVVVFNYEI